MSSRRITDFLTGIAALALVSLPASAQYPGQIATTDKSAPELRAVSVLEWTGDIAHPKASRLVPVSVFDGQQLQDGGLYLAQPEPLALEGEVEYLLKDNGRNTGMFVIGNAAVEQGAWVGYGTWKPLAKPKPAQTATAQSWKEDDQDSGRPTLHRKAHSDDSSGTSSSASKGPAPDPDRPTLHKGGDAGTNSNSGSSSGSAPDPDRPTLHKGGDAGSSGDSSASSSAPAADPDRPVLHKSTDQPRNGSDPDRPKLTNKDDDDQQAHVSSLPDISDPDRPRLIPGRPADMGPTVLPSLVGLPPDMEQAVAVSDSKNTPEHVWSYSWSNPEDETKFKAQLEDIARTALGLNPGTPPAPVKTAVKKATTTHKSKLALPAPPAPLIDEHFRVFELAYGSGATLVLSARTDGSGADEKFVTLVAQPDLYGNLAVLLKNVTDAAHLDDKPRMRLVDAVDAMADNRGELLFELRGQTQRQFALYRVLRGQITQIFAAGDRDLTVTTRQAAN